MGKFADTIRAKRIAKRISVRDFAELLGVTAGYISRIEVRGEIPSPTMICAFAHMLHLNAKTLLDLAKDDVVARTEKDLTARHGQALRLYRKGKYARLK
ncbi:MAG: helix-turn-helix domain-containing protein [Gemmataceae bacterium]